jgi:predicted enzyme related to lactoylglutathione lyase
MTTPITSDSAAPSPGTQSASGVRGRFIWHELLARDADAAVGFYPDVASWSTTTMSPAEGVPPYTMFVNGELPVAGVMAIPEAEKQRGAPASWLPYMGTADVDATFGEALSMGAKGMLSPMDVPTVGRIAVLSDPQGAFFALFAPSSPLPAEAAPQHGEFSWHDLATTDPVAAFDFYSRLFGWQKAEAMDMGAAGVYQTFGQGDFMYGGVYTKSPDVPVAHWNSYIQVANLERAVDAVRAHGGQILRGPDEVPGGDRIVMCVDDQGAAFALHGKRG